MKNTVVVAAAFVAVLLVFGSCTHTTTVGPVATGITGSWQWVMSTGGIAGITKTPASVGYTRRAVYGTDGMYEEFRNDSLIRAVRYWLLREQSPFHGGLADIVHYADTTTTLPQEVTLVGTDTLRLMDLCLDCYIHTYARIR